MTNEVRIASIGTEAFYNASHSYSLVDMHEYVIDVWETFIEDGSGAYQGGFAVYQQEIPEDDIELCPYKTECDYYDLWDRADAADEWLQDNGPSYNYDVILVADYWGKGNKGMNGASQSKAGTSENVVSIVDVANAKDLNNQWYNEKVIGTAAHEILHMFIDEGTSEHYPKSESFNGLTSLMYDPDIANWCQYSHAPEEVHKDVSSCTVNRVREFMDNRI